MDDIKVGIDSLDNDIVCIIIMTFMKFPQNRNIRKVKIDSDYCLVYKNNKKWHKINDEIAITKFLAKYIPIIIGQLMYLYDKINDKENHKEYIKSLTFKMYILNEVLNGNMLFIELLYRQIRELIFYITKKYNPELVI